MSPQAESTGDNIDALISRIAKLEATAKGNGRDWWDKLSIAPPVLIALAGGLVAFVGANFTRAFQTSQKLLSEAQVIQSLMPSLRSTDQAEKSVAIIAVSAYDNELARWIANAIDAPWADGLSLSLAGTPGATTGSGTGDGTGYPIVPWRGSKTGSGLDRATPVNLLFSTDPVQRLAAVQYLAKHPEKDPRVLGELQVLANDKNQTLQQAATAAQQAATQAPSG
jgi:hypothetical protein